jgi:hypothetical protein
MTKMAQIFLLFFSIVIANYSHAASNKIPELPSWQVLEFEQKAFWATAKSQLEILPASGQSDVWVLDVLSSVVDNSEKVQLTFDPATGNVLTRSRISSGKEQRMKSYQYKANFIARERRNPAKDSNVPPDQWPITNTKRVEYPASRGTTPVISPYLLVVLASQLQAQGPGNSMEVLVNTDLNFYRVKLNSGDGVSVDADYKVAGEDAVSGKRETVAVSIQATPEGTLEDNDDFSLLGLQGDIILLFDRANGLPVQIRGVAPRIGSTEINLKSAKIRSAP